jgi:hypothetical protein
MIRYNPDPHAKRYAYVPKEAVTAIFPPGQECDAALRELTDSGFANDNLDVYKGSEGADKLDMEGLHHGFWVRMMRRLEDMFTDDAYLFHKTDHALREGSTLVAVPTHGKEVERRQALDILKKNGGTDPVYWGKWVTETF